MNAAPLSISVRAIVDIVCSHLRVRPADVVSHRRDSDSVNARHIVCWLAARCTDKSYPTIGRALGRDHTSILNAARRIGERRAADPAFAGLLDLLEREVVARAEEIVRTGTPPPTDIDAARAARRVLGAPRGANRVSVQEIEAMAAAVLAGEDLRLAAIRLLTADSPPDAISHLDLLIDGIVDIVDPDEQATRAASLAPSTPTASQPVAEQKELA